MLLYSSDVWGAYDKIIPQEMEYGLVNKIQQFFTLPGLKKDGAPNVVALNEMERLSLK